MKSVFRSYYFLCKIQKSITFAEIFTRESCTGPVAELDRATAF